MEAAESFKIYWNLHKGDAEATKTFDLLWDLHQQTCNCYAPKTRLNEFFENKVVLWSLCKYIFGQADVNPLALSMNTLYINARERSKLVPSEVISSHTRRVHHRLLEYMLSNNTDSYQKLLVEEEKNLDKMTHALMAIYFAKWDYLPDLSNEITNPQNAKLLVRMFARHGNPSTEMINVFGTPQTALKHFSYAKCICFAAGAYNNKSLSNDLAKELPEYVGCIAHGARTFAHDKLADRFQRLLTPISPSRAVTTSNCTTTTITGYMIFHCIYCVAFILFCMGVLLFK